jgi:bacterial/archaeal transporter family protein
MSWQLYAVVSAIAAGATAVLAKVGLEGVPSNLATAVRTAMVLVLAIGIVFASGEHRDAAAKLTGRAWLFLALSAVATAVSWLAYFKALAAGPATPVTAIDKGSLVVTWLLAVAFLGEALVVAGAFLMSAK